VDADRVKILIPPELLPQLAGGRRRIGLGDLVKKITKAVGVSPCGGCEKRRKALNKFTVKW